MIGSFSARRRIGRPPSTENCNFLHLNLSLGHFPGRAGSRQHCVVCSKHGERRDTWCVCTVCSVHLCDALTGRECFRRYHTLREY